MNAAGWSVIGLSFGGAAAACVLVGASYPIAIWAVAFGVGYKVTHPEPARMCPLATIAAAEEGDGHVVVKASTERE